jgi:hypothetical protein
MSDNPLKRLYREDLTEHASVPRVGTGEYARLRERDRLRRAAAREALEELRSAEAASAEDLFHAAWLFNHGDAPDEAKQAHAWALEAASRGFGPARWLTAAAYDRWMMYEGRPQKYGTQFVPDGTRYRLWDVDPETTDEDRAEWGVPPLREQRERAERMSLAEPQPPPGGAPSWLKTAIERWKAEGTA